MEAKVREFYLFEWQELCRQLGVSIPTETRIPDIFAIVCAAHPSSTLAQRYFCSYFSDLESRLSTIPQLVANLLSSEKPRRLQRGIKKFNAPRGVHFCPDRGGYFALVSLFGEKVEIPPQSDANMVAKLCQRIKAKAVNVKSGKDQRIFTDRVKVALENLKNTTVTRPPRVPSDTDSQQPVGIITPETGTPIKRPRMGTPSSAPDRMFGGSNDPEILKFRDKFYCRYQVLGEFLSSPMRPTRSEAEADFLAIIGELERFALNGATEGVISPVEKSDLLSHFRSFNQNVASKRAPPLFRTPQTEARPAPRRSDENIFKIRDKFYTSMRLFDQQLSTPLRTTINEAIRDRDMLHSEIENIQNAKFRNEHERSKVVSEIKMRISSSYM